MAPDTLAWLSSMSLFLTLHFLILWWLPSEKLIFCCSPKHVIAPAVYPLQPIFPTQVSIVEQNCRKNYLDISARSVTFSNWSSSVEPQSAPPSLWQPTPAYQPLHWSVAYLAMHNTLLTNHCTELLHIIAVNDYILSQWNAPRKPTLLTSYCTAYHCIPLPREPPPFLLYNQPIMHCVAKFG